MNWVLIVSSVIGSVLGHMIYDATQRWVRR